MHPREWYWLAKVEQAKADARQDAHGGAGMTQAELDEIDAFYAEYLKTHGNDKGRDPPTVRG